MGLTVEALDEIFVYHKWLPEQVERGNTIRDAAKKAAQAWFATRVAMTALHDAITQSAAETPPENPILAEYAQCRRARSLDKLHRLTVSEGTVQDIAADLNEIVMIANAAITFEAPKLIPIAPELAHSERVEAAV